MGRVAGLTAEETRRRVLEGAVAVFAEKGYDAARITDIARAANLSTGAMYNHYESKADLLAAVVDGPAGEQLSALLAAHPGVSVLDLIETRARLLDRGPVPAPLLVEAVTAARRDPDVLASLTRQVRGSEEFFGDLVRLAQGSAEVVADVDPSAVARFCLMLILGSLLVRSMNLPSVESGSWDDVISRVIDGFRPTEMP